MDPDLNVGTDDGFVGVEAIGSSSSATAVEAVRTKVYPTQSKKGLLKESFEPNTTTHLDPAYQATSFFGGSIDSICEGGELGGELSLASFGMLEDLLLKAKLLGGKRKCGESVWKVSFLWSCRYCSFGKWGFPFHVFITYH